MARPRNEEGADMRTRDIYGTQRLLRDLVAVGVMQQGRPPASERVESLLGAELAGVLRATLTGTPGPAQRLQHRAA
jgi:hypothetical protein